VLVDVHPAGTSAGAVADHGEHVLTALEEIDRLHAEVLPGFSPLLDAAPDLVLATEDGLVDNAAGPVPFASGCNIAMKPSTSPASAAWP
jgi:hypothetical protein